MPFARARLASPGRLARQARPGPPSRSGLRRRVLGERRPRPTTPGDRRRRPTGAAAGRERSPPRRTERGTCTAGPPTKSADGPRPGGPLQLANRERRLAVATRPRPAPANATRMREPPADGNATGAQKPGAVVELPRETPLKTGVYWIASGFPTWCGRTKNDSQSPRSWSAPDDAVEAALAADRELELDRAVVQLHVPRRSPSRSRAGRTRGRGARADRPVRPVPELGLGTGRPAARPLSARAASTSARCRASRASGSRSGRARP